MQAARRVYVYLVSFISLMVMLAGATALLRLALQAALGVEQDDFLGDDFVRQQFSFNAALLVVGGAVWAIHWLLAQRGVAGVGMAAAAERNSALRKLMIYGALLATGWQWFFALREVLLQLLLSIMAGAGDEVLAPLTAGLATMVVSGAAWLYYWRVRGADARATPEEGAAATVRRWYFYLALYGTLSVLMFALADMARFLWRAATTVSAAGTVGALLPGPLPGQISWLLASLALWLWHWAFVQRLVKVSAGEQRSVLRKVYLYGVILQAVAVTIGAVALFIYNQEGQVSVAYLSLSSSYKH